MFAYINNFVNILW